MVSIWYTALFHLFRRRAPSSGPLSSRLLAKITVIGGGGGKAGFQALKEDEGAAASGIDLSDLEFSSVRLSAAAAGAAVALRGEVAAAGRAPATGEGGSSKTLSVNADISCPGQRRRLR